MIRLFVNFYADPDPARAAELAECLNRNVALPLIGELVILKGRPTFAEWFAAVNRLAGPDDVSIVANSDIYFDGTLSHAPALRGDECFALSRWDVTDNGGAVLFERADSQDAWMFRGPVRPAAAHFPPGVRGCDNRLARLLAGAGYRVSNPSRTIRANHLHRSGVRRYGSGPGDCVPGPYLLVPPVALPAALSAIVPAEAPAGRRILHLALLTPGSPQWGLRNALRSISDEYRELDWYPYCEAGRVGELRGEFVRLLREFGPTLVFAQVQASGVLSADELRRAGCPVVSWCGNLRDATPDWAWELAPYVISCFSNLRDVGALAARGYRARYLQVGFSPDVYTPHGPPRPGTPEVVFMGNNYDWFPLSRQRREMVAMLARRYGRRFAQFGRDWSPAVAALDEAEEAAAYRTCKVAINQDLYRDVPRFTSDRLFRAAGSGAFVLSSHYPGIELELTPGEHLAVWRDFGELTRQIDYYLDHDDERRRVAAAGCARAHADHTWAARMKDLLALVETTPADTAASTPTGEASRAGEWWVGLDRYAAKVYCQTVEDGVIERLFECLGTTNRFLVDIGAGDGTTLSNTRALIERGWSGLLLDAEPGESRGVIRARISAENVNAVLDGHDVPPEPDLLSLDIDGTDYWVWHALRRRPRVVVLEFNGTIPEGERRTIPYDPGFRWDGASDYYGASLAAFETLGRSKGYTLVHQVHALNAFFVRSDLLPPGARPVVHYTRHQYHPVDPHRRPWQAVPDHSRAFNGDHFATEEVAALCRRYAVVTAIEGGTFEGDTTPFLAAQADRAWTIEVNDAYWPRAAHLDAIPNVTRVNGSCPVVLRDLLPRVPRPVLYFADSHWGEPSPLPDELRAFAECGVKPVLVIHDFKNPDHPEYGFDTYGGQPYEWEWVRPLVQEIYGRNYRHYYNGPAAGARRGIVYVVPSD